MYRAQFRMFQVHSSVPSITICMKVSLLSIGLSFRSSDSPNLFDTQFKDDQGFGTPNLRRAIELDLGNSYRLSTIWSARHWQAYLAQFP